MRRGDRTLEQRKQIPYITILLIAANFIVFFITEFTGSSEDPDHMIAMGAAFEPLILQQHEWYRLITHFFLHFGWDHLINNMVSLAVLGYALEANMGRISYLVFYFLCGILAGVSSIVYNVYIGAQYTVSAGASGAIYGLMGALLVMLIIGNRGRKRSTEVPRFMIYLAFSIYSGLQDTSIDNAAHIGGFAAGVVICFLMSRIKRMEVSYES